MDKHSSPGAAGQRPHAQEVVAEREYSISCFAKARILIPPRDDWWLYGALTADHIAVERLLQREVLWALRDYLEHQLEKAPPGMQDLQRIAASLAAHRPTASPAHKRANYICDQLDTLANDIIQATVGAPQVQPEG